MATYEAKKYATIPIAATQVADGTVSNSEFQFINTLSSNAQTQTQVLPIHIDRCDNERFSFHTISQVLLSLDVSGNGSIVGKHCAFASD